MQLSASRSYLSKWKYGATVKFINSNYGQYRSNGIAVDVGVLYHDSAKLFSASVLAKNMGTQLKKYDGTDPDDLPFDLQVGLTKRLGKLTLRFFFYLPITSIHLIYGIMTPLSMPTTDLKKTVQKNSRSINCFAILCWQQRSISLAKWRLLPDTIT
jgi:hypothetical protein